MIDVDITNMPLVFIDVETTGFSPSKCRVIEIAAIRVENGQEAARMTSFCKIDDEIPEIITKITGITADHLKNAPVFADVAPQIQQILDGAIFVAHNAKFDYSFIKAEFERLELPFTTITLCTMELSRRLYPDMPRHKLGDLISFHQFEVEARHRAADDAGVLVKFIEKCRSDHPERALEAAREVLV